MTVDFLELITDSEIQKIPKQMRRFLETDTGHSMGEPTWDYFAYSFSAGFEQLATQAWKRVATAGVSSSSCTISVPALDRTIGQGGDRGLLVSQRLTRRVGGHNLHLLWNELLKQIARGGFPVDDEWTWHCGRLIAHIHQFDPNGERFRYPENRMGSPFDLTRVEFGELLKAHWHIVNYCGAVTSMFDASSPY
jgi:hypothetical protein